MFQRAHLVKVSISVNAWLGIVGTPWKRIDAVTIVPRKIGMIKTELIGMEYGWGMDGLVFEGKLWYRLKDDTCTLAQSAVEYHPNKLQHMGICFLNHIS